MEPRRDDTDLATELKALRPTPQPRFTAELDARAAAGFPPRAEDGESPRPTARLAERLRRMPRWRVPAVAGAMATVAIAVATAVIAISDETALTPTAEERAVAPMAQRPAPSARLRPFAGRPSTQFAGEPPVAERASRAATEADSSRAPLRDAFAPLDREVEAAGGANHDGAAGYATGSNLRLSGPNAFLASRRDVERSAQIVLAPEPSEVRAAAARVFETVRSYDGVVLRSSISADESGGGAVFDLLIPSGKLGGAMAAFSEIADVRSRRDATSDVTGRTTGLEERLRDGRGRVEALLGELAEASTEAERSAVERQLELERRRLAALRSGLRSLERRVNLSRVSLRIVGSPAAGAGDGRWGVDDALDDAGRILGIAAGVVVIGLAVLGPLALLLALAWLATRSWAKRRRERALD
jgi:Domain of unknown function (DUF4349)